MKNEAKLLTLSNWRGEASDQCSARFQRAFSRWKRDAGEIEDVARAGEALSFDAFPVDKDPVVRSEVFDDPAGVVG